MENMVSNLKAISMTLNTIQVHGKQNLMALGGCIDIIDQMIAESINANAMDNVADLEELSND